MTDYARNHAELPQARDALAGDLSPVLGQFLAYTQRARHVFPLERRHG